MNLAKDIAADGSTVDYTGIDSEGTPQQTLVPIIEGTLNIAGSVYADSAEFVREQYPNLVLNVTGGYYIRFADKAVQDICVANWGDGTGITEAQAAAVTTIGTTFKGNTSIVSFPELGTKFKNVTSLGSAFTNCTSLESVNLDNITTLTASDDNDAFYGSGIKEVSMPNLEKMTGPYPAAFMSSQIERVLSLGRLKEFVTNSGNFGFFRNCSKLKFINLPETLTKISWSTFINTSNVEEMNLPHSLTIIDSLPGGTWTEGMSLNLPNLTSIGDVFAGSHLVRVENLGTITKTGITSGNFGANGIFRNSKKLEFVRMPSTITQIGISAFYHCTALQTIIVEAITPPTLCENAFGDTPIASKKGTIYVSDASVDAYKAASGWSNYSDIIKPLSEYVE